MTSQVNGTMLLSLRGVTPAQVMNLLGEKLEGSSVKFYDPINGSHWALFSPKEEAKVYAGSNGTILHRLSFNPWLKLPQGIDEDMVSIITLLDCDFSRDPEHNIYLHHSQQTWAVKSSSIVTEIIGQNGRTKELATHWSIYSNTGNISEVVELYDLIESGMGPVMPELEQARSNRLAITALKEGCPPRRTVLP